MLAEVLHHRDHGGFDAVLAYEKRFGAIASASMAGWEEIDGVVEITEDEFERVWAPAREVLGRRVPP